MIVYMLLCEYDNGMVREIRLFTNRYKAQKYKQIINKDNTYSGTTCVIRQMKLC
jgi:hypothetical protein